MSLACQPVRCGLFHKSHDIGKGVRDISAAVVQSRMRDRKLIARRQPARLSLGARVDDSVSCERAFSVRTSVTSPVEGEVERDRSTCGFYSRQEGRRSARVARGRGMLSPLAEACDNLPCLRTDLLTDVATSMHCMCVRFAHFRCPADRAHDSDSILAETSMRPNPQTPDYIPCRHLPGLATVFARHHGTPAAASRGRLLRSQP